MTISVIDLLKQWKELSDPTKHREAMIKHYGLKRDEFLARMEEYLTPEDREKIKGLEPDTYFWPTMVGNREEAAESSVLVNLSFEYGKE